MNRKLLVRASTMRTFNGKRSNCAQVPPGVPQRSICLGTTLVCNLCQWKHLLDIAAYITMKRERDWKNGLECKEVCSPRFYKIGKKQRETKCYINNNLVRNEPVRKYLSLILSTNSSWNAHVDEVILKAWKALNFILNLTWTKLPV